MRSCRPETGNHLCLSSPAELTYPLEATPHKEAQGPDDVLEAFSVALEADLGDTAASCGWQSVWAIATLLKVPRLTVGRVMSYWRSEPSPPTGRSVLAASAACASFKWYAARSW